MDAPADEHEQVSPTDLKAQFEEEMQKFKDAVAKETAASNERLEALQKENDELRAALVRQTLVPPVPEPEPVHEPTEEEIYALRVENGIKVTKELMKARI